MAPKPLVPLRGKGVMEGGGVTYNTKGNDKRVLKGLHQRKRVLCERGIEKVREREREREREGWNVFV